MRKLKKGKRSSATKALSFGRGFDLGDQKGALILPDSDFNQAFRDANIVACAYGCDQVVGFPSLLPALTIVGEHREPLKRAFAHFARWGCEEDGDVVDIQLMLKNDGSYFMIIAPEVERAMHRLAPHHQLLRPLVFNLCYVKTFDTTNPELLRIAEYCRSQLAPVLITAGTISLSPRPPDPSSVMLVPDLPRLVKFRLKIHREKSDPDHWLLRMSLKDGKRQGKLNTSSPIPNPQECAKLRRKTINVAFPVSRERIRRAGFIEAVRGLAGFEDVGADQIKQAAINLMLSAELADGRAHFARIGPNFRDVVWKHILNRVDRAGDENTIEGLDHAAVAAQVELDVAAVLARHGIPTANVKFRSLQAHFRRSGYAGE